MFDCRRTTTSDVVELDMPLTFSHHSVWHAEKLTSDLSYTADPAHTDQCGLSAPYYAAACTTNTTAKCTNVTDESAGAIQDLNRNDEEGGPR